MNRTRKPLDSFMAGVGLMAITGLLGICIMSRLSVLPKQWLVPVTLLAFLVSMGLCAMIGLRLCRPRLPRPGQPVALEADALPPGRLCIRELLLPDGPVTPGPMSPGSSMLLCAYAAALLTPEEEAMGDAVDRCLNRMGIRQEQVRKRMPHTADVTDKGLIWQLHRDGGHIRAFTCGSPEKLLPLCGSMLGKRPIPLPRTLRTSLIDRMAQEPVTPLCYATASWDGSSLGEPVYLGAFRPEEEPAPAVQEEVDLLRSMGLTCFVSPPDAPEAVRLNALLGLEPQGAEDAFLCRMQDSERLSSLITRAQLHRRNLVMCFLQCATLMVMLAATLMVTGQESYPMSTFGYHMLLLLIMAVLVPVGRLRITRPRDILCLVLSGLVTMTCMGFAASYAGLCGIVRYPVVNAALAPFLVRCIHANTLRYGFSRRGRILLPLIVETPVLLNALLLGDDPLSVCFGLAVGCFSAVAGYLLCGLVRRWGRG